MDLLLVRQAMQAQPPQMIGFQYRKKDGTVEMYTVEPYEIDEGQNIFWGFKINDPKPGTRRFYMHNMFAEQLLAQVFSPRWTLYPFGKGG